VLSSPYEGRPKDEDDLHPKLLETWFEKKIKKKGEQAITEPKEPQKKRSTTSHHGSRVESMRGRARGNHTIAKWAVINNRGSTSYLAEESGESTSRGGGPGRVKEPGKAGMTEGRISVCGKTFANKKKGRSTS